MKKVIAVGAIISLVAFGSVAADDSSVRQPKNAGIATAASLTGAIFVPIVGPGLGHLYAHNMKQFYIGLGLRSAGVGLVLIAIGASWNYPSDEGDAAGAIGLILYGGSSLYDILTAGSAANRYNRKHGLAGVDITPTYFASQKAFGVQVSLGF